MAISLVQQNSGMDTSGGTGSVSVAFSSNNTAGNTLIVAIGSGNGATNGNLTSFSDTRGNTYTKKIDDNTNQGDGVQLWVCDSCAAGANTVSVSDGSFATAMGIWEVSGLNSSGSFDKSVITEVTGASPSSGSTATLSNANEFVIAFVASGPHNGTAYSVGSGYSNFAAQAGQFIDFGMQSKIVSSTTAVSAAFGGGTAGVVNKVVVATFQAAAGGGGTTTHNLLLMGVGT